MNDLEKSNVRLLNELKSLYGLLLKSNTEIEEKAWNILRFTTATIGVGAGIGIFEGPLDTLARLGLGIALIVYGIQVILVARLSEPQGLAAPPEIPETESMQAFFEDYYNTTEPELVTRLIIDYAGTTNPENKGAISKIKYENDKKSEEVKTITTTLFIILGALGIGFGLSAIGLSDDFDSIINWLF